MTPRPPSTPMRYLGRAAAAATPGSVRKDDTLLWLAAPSPTCPAHPHTPSQVSGSSSSGRRPACSAPQLHAQHPQRQCLRVLYYQEVQLAHDISEACSEGGSHIRAW